MSAGQRDERPATVVQVNDGRYPRAKVFTWPARARSRAQIKRDRFVHNLKGQYRQLKEALAAAKHFFVVCQVSKNHLKAIHKAHAEALDDLSQRFQAKINEYDRRISGGK